MNGKRVPKGKAGTKGKTKTKSAKLPRIEDVFTKKGDLKTVLSKGRRNKSVEKEDLTGGKKKTSVYGVTIVPYGPGTYKVGIPHILILPIRMPYTLNTASPVNKDRLPAMNQQIRDSRAARMSAGRCTDRRARLG